MKRKWMCLLLSLLCLLGLVGCGKEEVDKSRIFQIYYINNLETKVEAHEYIMRSDSPEERLAELVKQLGLIPEKLEYKAPLSMGFQLLEYELKDGKLMLNVDEHYKEMKPSTEVLVRAAIVRTLTQLPEVSFVGITVNGNQLYDNLDMLVGWMSADQFIDNAGNEINTYETVRLKLYFADAEGDGLVAVEKSRRYNSNIALEKLVMEELIKGPEQEGCYPSINPETKINSIMVKDGICYVNLDSTFLTQIYNVSADVTIFSIVNSLIELSNVNKVQFSINGDSTGVYREKYQLSTVFERNLDLVGELEY